jgi:DNA polymerase (family X)
VVEPATVAAQLRELGVYYDLDGDRHRAFAYDRAAKSIEAAPGLHRLVDEGRLEELPGIGPSIARVVADLVRGNDVPVLARLRATWPPVVVELAQLPRVGVQKARKIYQAFHPTDLAAVAGLCAAGAVRELPGFGKVTELKILTAIEQRRREGAQLILIDAEAHAGSLAQHLRGAAGVTRVEIAGGVRRCCEIVDAIAFAVATPDPTAVADRLAEFPLVTSIARPAAAAEPIVGHLAGGVRVEVHAVAPHRFGWALICATGAPGHVAALEARAAERGLHLAVLDAPDEELVYTALGLPWLPPEVRDGTDELAAAIAGDHFTDLVTRDDLTVATHCHTTYSDGKHSIAEMVRGAAERGFQAITITDHSAAATYANGLDLERLRAQRAEIAGLAGPEARVLHGTEADILADGTIDVPPAMLGELDLVIASVHQRYKLDEDGHTTRLIAAMRAPHFKIWGHALGRLVLRREPIAVRLDEVLDAIAESPAAIELNGDPYRLDLDPVHARDAARRGIPFVLSSDAHSVGALDAVRYAVGMARRARLRKKDVLNTLPAAELAERIRPVR